MPSSCVWPLADPCVAAGCPPCGHWLSHVTDSENTFFTAESPVGQGCAPVSALRVPGPGPIHTARALSHARLAAAEDITGPRGLVPVACTASDLRGGPGHLATTSFFGHVPLLSLPCRCPRLASGSSNCRFSPCPLPPAWGPGRLAPEKAGGRRRAQHDFLAGIPSAPHALPASRVRPRQAPRPPRLLPVQSRRGPCHRCPCYHAVSPFAARWFPGAAFCSRGSHGPVLCRRGCPSRPLSLTCTPFSCRIFRCPSLGDTLPAAVAVTKCPGLGSCGNDLSPHRPGGRKSEAKAPAGLVAAAASSLTSCRGLVRPPLRPHPCRPPRAHIPLPTGWIPLKWPY